MEKSKTTGIFIQATESQKQQIKSIAKACGLKQGDYILKTALGYRPKAVLPDAFFIYYDSLVKFLNSDLTPDVQKKALALFDKIYNEFLDVKKLSKAEIKKEVKIAEATENDIERVWDVGNYGIVAGKK